MIDLKIVINFSLQCFFEYTNSGLSRTNPEKEKKNAKIGITENYNSIDMDLNSHQSFALHITALSIFLLKVIIHQSRGEQFLWNRN